MKKHNIFPHSYYCVDLHGRAQCPKLAEVVWNRVRGDRSRYAVDMEIISENSIKVYAYDMACNVYGGIGNRTHTCVVTEFTEVEQALLDEYILELKTAAAAEEFHRREEDARNKAVMKIRKELFGV
jgi:hypothetical protein